MADIDAYKRQLLDVDGSVTNQYTLVRRVAYHLRSRLPSNISEMIWARAWRVYCKLKPLSITARY